MARHLTKTELTPERQKYAEEFYKKWNRHILRTAFTMWPRGDHEELAGYALENILRRISMHGPLREGSEMWYIKKTIGRVISHRLDSNREDSYVFNDEPFEVEGGIFPPVQEADFPVLQSDGEIDRILAPCSEKQRQALLLRFSGNDMSYDEIAEAMGTSKQAVYDLISSGIHVIRRYFNAEAYRKDIKRRKRSRIMCVETGKVYKNLEEASIDTGVSQPSISRVINGYLQSSKGLTFKRLD